MIHFHGGPITPDTCALKAWKGRHAFISFANPGQLALASEVTQSFALDNGAFSFWTKKRVVNWNDYYAFVGRWMNHPRFAFAVIPDVIGGTSEENDALIAEWPHGKVVGAYASVAWGNTTQSARAHVGQSYAISSVTLST